MPQLTLSQGNKKLGKIPNHSQNNVTTCPGASEWCAANCYVDNFKKRFGLEPKYLDNGTIGLTPEFVPLMVKVVGKAPEFRQHVSGDFDSIIYIKHWIEIVKACPTTRFFAYTRSWRVAELVPYLEQLRALPNMQLFASTDHTIAEPTPAGWRVAFMAEDPRATGYPCPEQEEPKRKPNCKACQYCIKGQRGNVIFSAH
jgi:hypothetical protein